MVEAKVVCQCYQIGEGSYDEMKKLYESVISEYGGECNLYVRKPNYQYYLNEKTNFSSVKKLWYR